MDTKDMESAGTEEVPACEGGEPGAASVEQVVERFLREVQTIETAALSPDPASEESSPEEGPAEVEAPPDVCGKLLADLESKAKQALQAISQHHAAEEQKEKAELERWTAEKEKWSAEYTRLFAELDPLIVKVGENVSSLNEDEEDFVHAPKEVQERLRNRKQALEIIARMFRRLPARKKDLADLGGDGESVLCSESPPMEVSLSALNDGSNTLDRVGSAIVRATEAIQAARYLATAGARDENYYAIRDERVRAENLKKAVVSFVKDHLLPAIDGVERGMGDEEELKRPLADYPESKDLTDRWFGIYPLCLEDIRSFLERVNLVRIEVGRGDRFNEDVHTALGVEPCDALENELIFSVGRSGYHYMGEFLRAAEVIVVKN